MIRVEELSLNPRPEYTSESNNHSTKFYEFIAQNSNNHVLSIKENFHNKESFNQINYLQNIH